MSVSVLYMSMSLDGYIAGPNDEVGNPGGDNFDRLPSLAANPAPLRELSFYLGRTHPLNAVLAPSLAPITEPPYAWYVRVPDLLAFLQLITPVLERRLANSPAAGYSGELTISLYRSGLYLRFDAGRLPEVAHGRRRPIALIPTRACRHWCFFSSCLATAAWRICATPFPT